jgi:hypothetical protein
MARSAIRMNWAAAAGSDNGAGGNGGGLVRITAQAVQLEGDVLANGGNGGTWAAAVLAAASSLRVGSLAGGGAIRANGGIGTGLGGGGGGGRVALLYNRRTNLTSPPSSPSAGRAALSMAPPAASISKDRTRLWAGWSSTPAAPTRPCSSPRYCHWPEASARRSQPINSPTPTPRSSPAA